jgi:folate-binding protein YgfZ
MPIAPLADRAVIAVSGEDAANFLGGLLTCAVDPKGPARYGALLTPQGKIIADFLLVPRSVAPGGFLLDVPRAEAQGLLKRLGLYKLRAKVTIADISGEFAVAAAWGEAAPGGPAGIPRFADPRFGPLGERLMGSPDMIAAIADAEAGAYDAHRIGLAVPQGGRDFLFGDAFPHEAGMDQLGGVDFGKGCYVGQEVVSRTQHRGTARTRVAALRFAGAPPSEGAEIRAGEKTLGRVGSVDPTAGRAVALMRLDRLADAMAAGATPMAGEVPVAASRPPWAVYAFPGADAETPR